MTRIIPFTYHTTYISFVISIHSLPYYNNKQNLGENHLRTICKSGPKKNRQNLFPELMQADGVRNCFCPDTEDRKRVEATVLGHRVRFPDGAPGYDNPGAACEPQVCGVGVGSLEGLASRRKYGPGIRWSRRSVSSGFPLLETHPRHVNKAATDCAEQWNGNMIDESHEHQTTKSVSIGISLLPRSAMEGTS